MPLKALVSQINYNLFDLEVGTQQSQFAYLQAKDLADAVEGLLRTHDVASLEWQRHFAEHADHSSNISARSAKSRPGATRPRSRRPTALWTGSKAVIAGMVANSSYEVRPTAIYANPVLLDLIDREMKAEFNVVLSTTEITGGLTVKTLSTQAGELPLIPEWAPLHGDTGQRHRGTSRAIS